MFLPWWSNGSLLQTWRLFSSLVSDRDSGEWVEVAIEGLAEEMLGQVWDRVGSASKARCLLLLRGFLQRARRCLSGPSQWHTGGGRWRSADGTTAASEKRVIDRRTGSEEEEEESDRVIE